MGVRGRRPLRHYSRQSRCLQRLFRFRASHTRNRKCPSGISSVAATLRFCDAAASSHIRQATFSRTSCATGAFADAGVGIFYIGGATRGGVAHQPPESPRFAPTGRVACILRRIGTASRESAAVQSTRDAVRYWRFATLLRPAGAIAAPGISNSAASAGIGWQRRKRGLSRHASHG